LQNPIADFFPESVHRNDIHADAQPFFKEVGQADQVKEGSSWSWTLACRIVRDSG
jgi:hypothetical protein